MKKQLIILSAIMVFVVAGCTGTGRFVYPEDMRELSRAAEGKPVYARKVAVVPFNDCRPNCGLGVTILLGIVPVVPYGFREYDRPEANGSFTSLGSCAFSPGEELAKAAAVSLKHANLFQDAYFTYGGEADRADYVLEGEVRSTYYKGRTFTYGFSIYSPVLWVVGAPLGTSLNRLSLQLRLKDRAGRVVWAYAFDRDDYLVQWLYYRNGQDVSLYARLMQQAMNSAVNSLAASGVKF